MDVKTMKLMMVYTNRRIQTGAKPFVNSIVNNTKQEMTTIWDMLSGNYKKKLQYQYIKLTNQINTIERNLNSSSAYNPRFIDILR